jgi:curved DNA-binding protein CbpA
MSEPGLDDLDYYTLLGIEDDADEEAIRRGFRSFARRYHPDLFRDADPKKRTRAERIYRRGSEAVQVLTDPASREMYGKALERGILRLTDEVRESFERARPVEKAPTEQQPIRNLEARTYFKRAVELTRIEDWVGAWKALRAATAAEPGNAFLEERFRKVAELARAHGARR